MKRRLAAAPSRTADRSSASRSTCVPARSRARNAPAKRGVPAASAGTRSPFISLISRRCSPPRKPRAAPRKNLSKKKRGNRVRRQPAPRSPLSLGRRRRNIFPRGKRSRGKRSRGRRSRGRLRRKAPLPRRKISARKSTAGARGSPSFCLRRKRRSAPRCAIC